MNVALFTWKCQTCGRDTSEAKLGMDEENDLWVLWTCENCQADNAFAIRFSDLITYSSQKLHDNQFDHNFLTAMHISES